MLIQIGPLSVEYDGLRTSAPASYDGGRTLRIGGEYVLVPSGARDWQVGRYESGGYTASAWEYDAERVAADLFDRMVRP